jgi:type II secretory pathway predicted ATPase ExeA
MIRLRNYRPLNKSFPAMPIQNSISGSTLRQLAERDERVFASYPQVSRYFPAAAIEDARQRLGRAIERGDGPGLLIGAPGTGKSLLLQVLAAQHHERFDVGLLACACLCTRRALLQAILFELGMPYKMRDEGELRLSLLDHLLGEDRQSCLLLLVDEAQLLSVALLDELRVLTNLVRNGVPRVRLVLAGSSALEESFANHELESFSQRLSTRCYVAPLSRDETCQFIRAQVAACRCAPDEVFAADAWGAIFDATDGVPRLINQLCDRSLLMAAAKDRRLIDCHVIQEAWADLQQLPTPWETPAADAADPPETPVVEFGRLRDDVLTDDGNDDVASFDVEPTELDTDDWLISAKIQTDDLPKAQPAEAVVAADPFAEKFDEEEVVLDNYAAWDDMFGRDTPRVSNRREPQFATLVQAAVNASPVAAVGREDDRLDMKLAADETARPAAATDAPRLRLAIVCDTPRAGQTDGIALADESKLDQFDIEPNDDPILVVEDDPSPSAEASPVRREEYRQLFSRLRSG